ncbi:MAG: ABC transporter ATP-binding protein [Acidimicrobiales bacterium]
MADTVNAVETAGAGGSVHPVHAGPLITMRGMGRRFPGEPPVNALIDVDLTVRPGDWLAIVGPSGSGKSTLLNIMGCLDNHTSGSYQLGGMEVSELSDRERAGLRSWAFGFVFQSFHLLAHRTVTENVMLADVYRRAPGADRGARAAEALRRVGLAERAGFLPTRLSGGERQRVAIARALMGSPSVMLCDEPTGNLDSVNTASLLDLFATLNREGVTIVMITHDTDVADRAGRRTRMADGRLMEVI